MERHGEVKKKGWVWRTPSGVSPVGSGTPSTTPRDNQPDPVVPWPSKLWDRKGHKLLGVCRGQNQTQVLAHAWLARDQFQRHFGVMTGCGEHGKLRMSHWGTCCQGSQVG